MRSPLHVSKEDTEQNAVIIKFVTRLVNFLNELNLSFSSKHFMPNKINVFYLA